MGENRRITLLGGEGFIGRNIATYFSKKADCLSVGMQPSPFEKRTAAFLYANPYQKMIKHESDIIVHLIDNPVPLESFLEQEEKLVKNIGLDARQHLILFSSAIVYVNPDSEYGKRKLLLERFYTEYCQERKIPLTILRLFNTYGPYQIPYRQGSLIANLIFNTLQGKPTEINDREAMRDFLYVGDIPKCIEYVILHKLTGVHDIGSGTLRSIKELIGTLEEVFGQPLDIRYRGVNEAVFSQRVEGGIVGNVALTGLTEGLEKTIRFYREYMPVIKKYVER